MPCPGGGCRALVCGEVPVVRWLTVNLLKRLVRTRQGLCLWRQKLQLREVVGTGPRGAACEPWPAPSSLGPGPAEGRGLCLPRTQLCRRLGPGRRPPGDGSREVGAGSGHALATQTPRSWEVQAGAARPLLSGLRPPQAGHVGSASEKHQPFPGPCTRAHSVRSCIYCFLWKHPIPSLPSAFPLERSTGASCLLLSPPDTPLHLRAGEAAFREGDRGPTPASEEGEAGLPVGSDVVPPPALGCAHV